MMVFKVGNVGIGRRMLAFIIDLLLINIIVFAPFRGVLLKVIPSSSFIFSIDDPSLYIIQSIINIIMMLSFFYFVLLEFTIGQTVGKILLNLKVIGTDKKISFFQCMLRSLFLFPLFPMLIFMIDIIYMFFFSKTKQRLSEHLSKTMVVMN
jgi:uncharacterized RDD family membrane protein YckC